MQDSSCLEDSWGHQMLLPARQIFIYIRHSKRRNNKSAKNYFKQKGFYVPQVYTNLPQRSQILTNINQAGCILIGTFYQIYTLHVELRIKHIIFEQNLRLLFYLKFFFFNKSKKNLTIVFFNHFLCRFHTFFVLIDFGNRYLKK